MQRSPNYRAFFFIITVDHGESGFARVEDSYIGSPWILCIRLSLKLQFHALRIDSAKPALIWQIWTLFLLLISDNMICACRPRAPSWSKLLSLSKYLELYFIAFVTLWNWIENLKNKISNTKDKRHRSPQCKVQETKATLT